MNERILIIDDEPNVLKTLTTILTKEGFQVKSFTSGKDAITSFQSTHFDLVITDIRMPGMDGLEIIRQVKQLDEDMEVIILTGHATLENAVQALSDNGAFAYLTKPLENIDELLNAVKQAMEKRRLRLENKTLMRKLKENEQWLAAMFKNIDDAVIASDGNGYIKFINPVAETLTGWKEQEIVGKKLDEICKIVNEETKDPTDNTIEKVLQEKVVAGLSNNTILIARDGRETPIDGSAAPIKDEKGQLTGLVVALRDITEQKCLQAQIIHAQKMEALGTMAGGIAHNFNNILMAIQGNTSLMLLKTDPTHPNYAQFKAIEGSVQRGSRLTRELLGYARKGKYEIKPISLNQIVEETSHTFGETKKEIRIHRELAKNLRGIKADQGQVEQVLLNFYINAAEAMVRGGDLFLTTMNVTHKDMGGKLFKAKPGNYVLLTITEIGTGMEKETVEHIFEPFFTTKGLANGTGLGLASVYGIIKAHGGYIDVESKIGHGITFYVYLPASGKILEKSFRISKQIIEGSGTILLIDDEEIVLDVGLQLLKTLGYNVLEAKGGAEAIEIFRKNKDKIDMVILDMIMPDRGGGETFYRMKEINPNVKVLLSSGYSIEGQASEILERGCDGFIQKPFNIMRLSQGIRGILDG